MRSGGLPLHWLAWTVALLPFVTNHVSYLIAAAYGHVDWCVPYWGSCTSISATGRMLPEKLWFKLGMIPAGVLTAVLWWSLGQWLLQSRAKDRRRTLNGMMLLGIVAAFFLILYTVALGEEGDAYQRIRRAGITLSFSLTYMAQLLLTHLLGVLAKVMENSFLSGWYRRLLALMILLLATGVASVFLDALMGPAYDNIDDAFEWVMALMLNLYFAGIAVIVARFKVTLALR